VLLLQDLVKHTPPKHADHANLAKALKKMKDVADYVNERKREAENLTQVLAIQSKLTGKFEVNKIK
jgi:RhoGEF domain